MNISLRSKVTWSTLSVVAIMGFALTGLAASQLKNQTQDSINQKSSYVSHVLVNGVSEWVDIRKSVTESVDPISGDAEVVTSQLQQAMASGDFDSTYMGTPSGKFIEAYARNMDSNYDPRVRGWYIQAEGARGDTVVTPSYSDATTGELMVTIAKYHKGQGVVASDVLLTSITDDVSNVDLGEGSAVVLIEKDTGSIVAHPNKNLITRNITELSNDLNIDSVTELIKSGEVSTIEVSGSDALVFAEEIHGTPWVILTSLDEAVEMDGYYASLKQLLLTSLAILVGVALVTSWLSGLLVRDLGIVSVALKEVAEGEGDLTKRIDVSSKDEIGELADNFNTFVDFMHKTVSQLKEVSGGLIEQSELTSTMATNRAERVNHQEGEVNTLAAAMEQMAVSTKEIAQSTIRTATSSSQAVEASEFGSEQVARSQQSIDKLVKEITGASTAIKELEEQGVSINKILATIQEIAAQTNLLALNAAIEAARAGEHGRGFAVVADEVRVLSQKTHTSTTEIQEMIEALQSTTQVAVTKMNESSVLAGGVVDDATNAAASLEQITSSITQINEMAEQISATTEEQTAVANDVSMNTQRIRDVSEELATDAVDGGSQAELLSDLSRKLEEEIGMFKI